MKVKAVIDICQKSKVFHFYTTNEGHMAEQRARYVPVVRRAASG